jgi:O-antigen biosynthesis protein
VRVSFLIPLFNNLALTQAMLASLQAHLPAGLDHEIVFIDDGSTDGTREWLRTITDRSGFRVLLNEKNLGYAATNNRAAATATGDVLVLLNNDLILTPRWLEPLLAQHALLGERAGVIGNVQRAVADGRIDHAGCVINAKAKPEHARALPAFAPPFLRCPAVTGACFLVPAKYWREAGGFDEAFINGGEDVDLCFRLRRAGREVGVATRSMIFHHVSASVGRKRRDEHNSRLLARRWRRELQEAALPGWTRAFAERLDAATAFSDPLGAIAAGLYAAGWLQRAPLMVRRSVATAMDAEWARWRELLGSDLSG